MFSLYDGKNKAPTAAMLENVTMLVFDVQDVGARCYTYISSMVECMKSAKQFNRTFVVLDRINPIGGSEVDVQGPVLELNYTSFVGIWSIVMRHGMTAGELAQLFNAEMKIFADLRIIKAVGWTNRAPSSQFDQYPWIPPSPNLPNFDSALLYPGMVLFEATTNISLGRGTPNPFFVIGAPFINAFRLVEYVQNLIEQYPALQTHFAHVKLVPTFFIPTTSYHANLLCNGLRLVVLKNVTLQDPLQLNPLAVSITLLRAVIDLYGTQQVKLSTTWINLLTGSNTVYNMLVNGSSPIQILQVFAQDEQAFILRRRPYLLY